jgi:hypothetical protein
MTINECKLIQSYVRDRYFVSTVLRESSSIEAPSKYFETFAWEWNSDTKELGEQVASEDASSWVDTAFKRHLEVCERLAGRHEEPFLKDPWKEYTKKT